VGRVTNWPARGAWWARFRRWWFHVVMCYESETCDRCGSRVEVAWMTSDECWRAAYTKATGCDRGSRGLLCLMCFDKAATAIGRPVVWCAFDIIQIGAVAESVGAFKRHE
jgi:hypothetical protein